MCLGLAFSRWTIAWGAPVNESLADQLEAAAESASAAWKLCLERGNHEQAEYNLGRREALLWAAMLARREEVFRI